MKKFITIAVMLGMAASFAAPYVIAATSIEGPITIGATVPVNFDLGLAMRRNDFAGPVITSMDFGTLGTITFTNPATGQPQTSGLRSVVTGSTGTGAVAAFLTGNSQGAPYTISQTGTALTGPGGATIPAANCTVVPVYAAADNGQLPLPAGAALGTAGSWVGTRTLYTSGGTGALRTIQAFYSITDDTAAGATGAVPLSQAAGAYTANVTFTLTT